MESIILPPFTYDMASIIFRPFLLTILRPFAYDMASIILRPFAYDMASIILRPFAYNMASIIFRPFAYDMASIILRPNAYDIISLYCDLLLTIWHQSCRGPSPHSTGRGLGGARGGRSRSSNSPPGSWSAGSSCQRPSGQIGQTAHSGAVPTPGRCTAMRAGWSRTCPQTGCLK